MIEWTDPKLGNTYLIIPKSELVDGAYYAGHCRNASVARWDARTQQFYYIRHKFGDTFVEGINHPEDDDGFDLFIVKSRMDEADVVEIIIPRD
jgi:hypothetical protein